MIKQYAKITRSDMDGHYTVPFELIGNAVDGEIEGNETGMSIIITIVEMEEDEYDGLPEFQGW